MEPCGFPLTLHLSPFTLHMMDPLTYLARRSVFIVVFWTATHAAASDPIYAVSDYRQTTLRGWRLMIHERLERESPKKTREALRLLEWQLQIIEQHVPARAVAELRKVPLWFSPQYPNVKPKAEYHISAKWLEEHRRPVEMVKAVEFTNIEIFAKEVRRMPVFVLHELAHAYHNRVLGLDHGGIEACYRAAMAENRYDRVMRSNGKLVKAYGTTNSQEYFAETTEAFFGFNDFFPFNREQLLSFDPRMYAVLATVWHATDAGRSQTPFGPIALHPNNPHYFLWRGRPTILVTSGEHYGALLNLDFDYERYFAELARHGLNHTRVFSGTYREIPGSFGITDNPLAPKPGRYLAPWARSDRPGYAMGGNRFDLTKFDPAYFRRLGDLLAEADKHGIVVELTLFCPLYNQELWKASPFHVDNNINGVGKCNRKEVLSLKEPELVEFQLAVTRRIVEAVNRFDNLYFEVCNEPYAVGVPEAWQRRIVQEIVKTEKGLPKRHLISWNISNGRKKIENPPNEVSIFNFHYCVPPDTVAMNYALNRVIGENETGFRGKADILYRTEAWDFLLAGGALYNNLDYSFTPAHPGGTFRKYRSPGGGSLELRQQLGFLKRFLEDFDFVRMKPDPHVVRRTEPTLTHHVLSEPGRQYAMIFHVPLPLRPKDLSRHLRSGLRVRLTLAIPAGKYRLEWVDPVAGQILQQQRLRHDGESLKLQSPVFDNEVALKIVKDD